MDWFIKRIIACSKTGNGFSIASSMNNLSLILWYRGDYFWHTENTLSTSSLGLIVNKKKEKHRNNSRISLFTILMVQFS